MKIPLSLFVSAGLLSLFSPELRAGGLQSFDSNFAVCRQPHGQTSPRLIGTDSGGVIITWEDLRTNFSYDVYAQLLRADGSSVWATDGISISSASDDQDDPQIASDGAGGAIIAWEDFRNGDYDIYAQRVLKSGAILWRANGVAVCSLASHQFSPKILSDGAGGAIIAWQDSRSGTNFDIYAQRINANGVPQWTPNGVPVCTSAHDQGSIQLVQAGTGVSILTWEDYRDTTITADIYAQKLTAIGAPQWTLNGVKVCGAVRDQLNPQLVGDGAGGAILVWEDHRDSTFNVHVFAQRLNANGIPQWLTDGVRVCQDAHDQFDPQLVNSGSGVIIGWEDFRDGPSDIYAQRVSGTGSNVWSSTGVLISNASASQFFPELAQDRAGGAIFVWEDHRNPSADIYGQHIDSSGTAPLASSEFALSTAPDAQALPQITGDSVGHIWVTWQDHRNSTDYDIYAQPLGVNTIQLLTGWNILSLPLAVSDGAKKTLFPSAISPAFGYNPAAGYQVADTLRNGPGYWLKFATSQLVSVTGEGVGADTIPVAAGWNLIGAVSRSLPTSAVVQDPPGIVTSNYFAYTTGYVRTTTLDPLRGYWVKVNQDGSLLLTTPGVQTPARAERLMTSLGEDLNTLTIHDALGNTQTLYFAAGLSRNLDDMRSSLPAYLKGELPPLPPPDVFDARFSTHRQAEFFPLDSHEPAAQRIVVQTDAYPLRISAEIRERVQYELKQKSIGTVLLAGKEEVIIKDPSTGVFFLSVAPASKQVPAQFALDQNFPNPFNSTTHIRFELPASQFVALKVFDVLGREVATLVNESLNAGRYSIPWDAGYLPSGMYYYRIQTPSYTATKKLTLLR